MEALWFAVCALCLGMYVLLDGYDLGIGILSLFAKDTHRRRTLVEIVATAWDGNETWIILFGVSAWAGLPGAYSTLLPAIYIPIIAMLFGIILRGAAIEMISQGEGAPIRWSLAFGFGSLVAALAQGAAIGGILSGVVVNNGEFDGGPMDFLTWFTVLTAVATVAMYVTAGAAFLQLKTEGYIRHVVGRIGKISVIVFAVLSLACALSMNATATPYRFDSPLRTTLFVVFAIVAAVGFAFAWYSFGRKPDNRPWMGVATAQIGGYLALLTMLVPLVVPPSVTLQDAVAPGETLIFLVIGVGLNIPLVMFYSWYSHHVFRGKHVNPDELRPVGFSASARALMTHGGSR